MNGFNSLVARIWGPFLLLSLAFMLLVGWYVPRQQQLALIEFQRQELTVMANTIARTMSIAAERDELLDIPLYFKAIEEQESIQFSALQFEGDATLITSPPNINREQFEADDPLLVKVPFQGGRISGTIFVKGATTYSEAQLKELSLPLQVALSLVVLTVSGLYFFLLVRVSKPLQSLRTTAETLRRGELDQPVDTRPRITEVRALNLALERLRSGLKEQRETNALLTQGMEREIRRQTKDLRKTLDELKDSRNLFGSVIESALDAVVLADGKSRIIEWNRKAEIIFGWTREEAVGKTLGELIIPHGFRESHDKGMDHYHATGHGPVLNKSFEIQAL
ncbi:MAG: PAS domain S-box protein, partial [Bacteroidota bacterium]|nr:PAS domain S-box protein [Bacteroidota bacterium]